MKEQPPSARAAAADLFLGFSDDDYQKPENLFGKTIATGMLAMRNSLEALAGQVANPAHAEILRQLAGQAEGLAAFSVDLDARARAAKQRLDIEITAAQKDGLTGLLNKNTFNKMTADHALLAAASGRPLCVLAVDGDYFKLINDIYGHQAGDNIIRMIAEALRENLRREDVPARWGGEEFFAILPGADEKTADGIAERIREKIAAWRGDGVTGPEKVTVSIGVAQFRVGEHPDHFVARADQALYEAKRAGRNRVVRAPAQPPVAASFPHL